LTLKIQIKCLLNEKLFLLKKQVLKMIRWYSLAKVALVFTIVVYAELSYAQTGASCASPQVITALPFNSGNITTCGFPDLYTPQMACGNAYIGGNDYVFRYTPSSPLNSCISLSLSGTNAGRGLFVFDGCPDLPATRCIAQAIDRTAPASISSVQLTVGTPYYIVVSAYYGCKPFGLSVSSAVCNAPAPGSTCATATTVPALPYNFSGSTCLKGNAYNSGNVCRDTYMDGEDYVLKYTAVANECISLSMSGLNVYSAVFVSNACPDDPRARCIAEGNTATGSTIQIPYISLNAGSTYYITVSSSPGTTPCTNFTLDLARVACGPTGTYCGDPFLIPALPFTHNSQTTCGFRANYKSNMGCSSYYLGGEDFVYKYTPAADQCIIASISGVTQYGTGIFIMDGCADEASTKCIAKGEAGPVTDPATAVATLKAGITYYIYVSSGYGCTPFNFTMQSRLLGQPGTSCSNPYTVTALPFSLTGMNTGCFGNDYTSADACGSRYMNGEDFVLRYTCTAPQNVRITLSNANAVAGLFVFDGAPDVPGTSCIARDSASWMDGPMVCNLAMTPGTYYIMVDTDPAPFNGTSFTPFDIAMEEVPPGTDCATPFVISSLPFTETNKTTACFRKDFSPADACGSFYMNAEDFVYRYDVSGNDCIRITLSNLNSYVGLFLVKGCPDDPASVCVAQAACSFSCSTLNVTSQVTPGTYYIVISGNWQPTSFDINVQSASVTAPVADFSSDTRVACLGDQVSFLDLSVPCIGTWSWQFPGGTPSVSAAKFPVITYNTPGQYDVTLTVSNAGGTSTVTKQKYIIVK
jgi:hypothetical protein